MTLSLIDGVPVVLWNPRRNRLPRPWRSMPIGRRVNNFGDLLGPLIIERILASSRAEPSRPPLARRVLSVGSILHLADSGDVVWGSGLNGKVGQAHYTFGSLDVRAVRGPLTREWLLRRNVDVPEVYGDPALLIPEVFPELRSCAESKVVELSLVPNLHDYQDFAGHPGLVNPRSPVSEVLRAIVQSERVVASSLHGFIVAEAFGIPAVLLRSRVEPSLKYTDYFRGTGRGGEVPIAEDLPSAMRLLDSTEVSRPGLPETWDSAALIAAFPWDAWGRGPQDRDLLS